MPEVIENTDSITMGTGMRDDLRQVAVVTKYELYKHMRSKRMLVYGGLCGLMIILITVLNIAVGDGLPGDAKELMQEYVSVVNVMVVVGAALFCAPALASEFEERTALLMFPRPMKKTTFFIGKMLACYIVCGAIIVMYYLISMAISLLNTGTVYPAAFASLGLALLFMAAVGGFALLMSTLLKKGSTAIIVTIAAMLLVFNMIDGILFMVDIEPVFSLVYASLDISNVVDGAVTTSNGSIGFGMTGSFFYPSHALAVSVMGIWAAVTTFLAVIMFGRREF